MLSFDTETSPIAPANLAPELACISWSDGKDADLVHWRDAYPIARWILEQPAVTTANGPYDLAVLWAMFPDLRDLIWDGVVNGRFHDVLIRQKLMDIGAGIYRRVFRRFQGEEKARPLYYGLDDMHLRYYNQAMEKSEWRLRFGELRKLYPLSQWPDGSKRYATYDAIVTADVHDLQDAAALKQGHTHNLWDEQPQFRAAWALHLSSCWGFRTDLKQVERVIGQIDNEQPVFAKQLLAVDLVRKKSDGVYSRREKLAKQLMYQAVGDAGELTDTGYKRVKDGEMTKEQALQAGYIKIDEDWCEVSKDPNLITYYHFRQNQLLRAKLVHIQVAAFYSVPIQTSFETIVETGRTSSRENKLIPNSMALQNPPRKPLLDEKGKPLLDATGRPLGGMRECFVARPGCTLIAADFGQAELVALAQVTFATFGYSKMRDLINAGLDLHIDFAKEIIALERSYKMAYEEAYALHKSKDPYMKDRRTLSKGFNFGKPGGLGAASFQSYVRKAWGVEISFEQSKNLGRAWLKHFPEMKDYFQWIGGLIEQGGGKTAVQQYMSMRWRGACSYTQACNTLFQGLTADAAKAAFFEVSRLCYTVKSSMLYGCRPLLFLHDEILTEAPREQASDAAKEKEKVMKEVYSRFTPDVRIGVDAHLMDRWSKEAEAVHDERGKLVPWEPPQSEDERAEWAELLAA